MQHSTPAALAAPASSARVVKPAPARVPTARETRQERFTARTHIYDLRVFRLFESVDSDHSGGLSIEEIQAFQSSLWRNYRYLNNGTALSPDQFLDAGGGDCDDWALMTAGMLRYWSFTPWMVIFGAGAGKAHAVCFLRVSQPSVGVGYVMIGSAAEFADGTLPAGCYIPIDYDQVGSLSNAVEPGWTIHDAWVPEKAYGQPL